MNKSTVKITTLTENLVYASGLKAEHGLSIFIETPTANILFDTGQSDVFIHNATKLGIDIASVDILILSHGHYDHTGGLYAFLELNSKAIVYAKHSLFKPKMHTDGRNIGTPYFQEKIEKRIHYVDSVLEVVPNISIFPTITIYNTIDTHFKGLQIQQESLLQEDTFEDEIFIVIKQSNTISIITACSHRGITNICKTATNYYNTSIQTLIGGFHTKEASELQYNCIKNYFNEYPVEKIAVCHCTGIDQYVRLSHDVSSHVVYNNTAKKITLNY